MSGRRDARPRSRAPRRPRYLSTPKGSSTECAGWVNQRAPVSVMTDPLLKVVNSRLRELGETPLEAAGRGIETVPVDPPFVTLGSAAPAAPAAAGPSVVLDDIRRAA